MPPKVCANSSCRIPDRGRKKKSTAAGSWKLKVIFSHITRIHILVVKFYPGPYKAWDILFWTKAVDRLTDRLTLPCLSQTTSTAKTFTMGAVNFYFALVWSWNNRVKPGIGENSCIHLAKLTDITLTDSIYQCINMLCCCFVRLTDTKTLVSGQTWHHSKDLNHSSLLKPPGLG